MKIKNLTYALSISLSLGMLGKAFASDISISGNKDPQIEKFLYSEPNSLKKRLVPYIHSDSLEIAGLGNNQSNLEEQGRIFSEFLEVTQNLKKLTFYNCFFLAGYSPISTETQKTIPTLSLIAQSLANHGTLETVRFEAMGLYDNGVASLAPMFQSGHLKHIFFRNCYFGSDGLKAIAVALNGNKTLESLSFNGNFLPKKATGIAFNDIDLSGLREFSKVLSTAALKSITIENDFLNEKNKEELIKSNPHIKFTFKQAL